MRGCLHHSKALTMPRLTRPCATTWPFLLLAFLFIGCGPSDSETGEGGDNTNPPGQVTASPSSSQADTSPTPSATSQASPSPEEPPELTPTPTPEAPAPTCPPPEPSLINEPIPLAEGEIEFTWLTNTNWLVRFGDRAILLDAWFSRSPYTALGYNEEGIAFIEGALAAAGVTALDAILIGHSHNDHASDAGIVALKYGAKVYGSQTTCLYTTGQGLPEEDCIEVGQGEGFAIGDALVSVIRAPHSGPESWGSHAEWEELPDNDLLSAPHGGPLVFLFTHPGESPIKWAYYDTQGPLDAIDGSGEDYRANFEAVFPQEGGITLWLSSIFPQGDRAVISSFLELLNPQIVMPQHWDSALESDYIYGISEPYPDPRWYREVIAEQGAQLVHPTEYFERLTLTSESLKSEEDAPIQRAFCL